MNLSAVIRQLEEKLTVKISMETLHAAFPDDPELRLSPDEYWHHSDDCRAKKLNPKTFPVCCANKARSVFIARRGRMFRGVCPYGVEELACPVIFEGSLAAVLYFGAVKRDAPLIDKEEIRHWACWLRDYVQLELARWSAVSANRKKKRSEDYYLKQCRAFIDRYYNRNPTLGDLAELLRVNPNYLGEIIRKHGGRNFRRMLLERRMREAEIFLKLHGGTMKIGEIAQLCGFSDSNYFSCCFRREYGITPGEFRSRGGNTGKAFQDTEPE